MALAAALRSIPFAVTCLPRKAVVAASAPLSLCSRTSNTLMIRCYAAGISDAVVNEEPRVALVTGASRGLGLEFTRQLLQRPGQSVVAACRNPSASKQLDKLAAEHGDALTTLRLDVTDETSIQAAVDVVLQQHQHLDLLLNVAGVLHVTGEFSPETALSRVDQRSLHSVFGVNTFGPILMSKAFAPLLINAAKVSGASEQRPAVIANLSARVGSISDNALGGWYSYRASKTALNQLTKTMAIEFQRRRQLVSCLLLHPGTVDTDLSAPFQKNVKPEKLFTRERAIRQLLAIIDKTTMADTGSFTAWDASPIPW